MSLVDAADERVTVLEELEDLRSALSASEMFWAAQIRSVDPGNRSSAANLAHYLALRQYDLRDLQRRLAELGLSSLGRCEPHVRASLEAVIAALTALIGGRVDAPVPAPVGFDEGRELLQRRAAGLLGPAPDVRRTRIMVTLPSLAANDRELVGELVGHGADLVRINCAHDDPKAWAAMAAHVRAAGRRCRIAMDLGGPKLRTGPLVDRPAVVKLRPARDALGHTIAPARCRLVAVDAATVPSNAPLPCVPVDGRWLSRRRPGERIALRDARGARRWLAVQSVECGQRGGISAVVSTDRTTYLTTGTSLRGRDQDSVSVGPLAPTAEALTLRRGDTLTLTRDCTPAPASATGPFRIGCTLPEVFGRVEVGDRIFLDDGKIGGVVTASEAAEIEVRVTRAAAGGSRLRAGKGINVPDADLPISALTDKDRADLESVIAHADLVQMSFVRGPRDVADLLTQLTRLGARRLGVIVKIETLAGFVRLPEILFALMRWPRTGVMIARGDLAIECGYERLAELQEEILWLCEAAHVPVVWATQVLDQLARSGQPSRAEITDAAMGVRAECVMLNKGPHIVAAVVALDDILRRMAAHQDKKMSLLRPLRSWLATLPS